MTDKDKQGRPILKLNSFGENKTKKVVDVDRKADLPKEIQKPEINDTIPAQAEVAAASSINSTINSDVTKKKKENPRVQAKKLLLEKSEYKEMLSYMQKHYPKCFLASGEALPLALGIHHQIFSNEDLPFSRMKIRKFLKAYTRQKSYRNILISNDNRYNLDGSSASKVLPEEANWLLWKEARDEKQKQTNHDSLVKKVMENPIAAAEFLDEFLPAEFKDILDLDSLKVEKESFVEESLKTRLSDIVYSVKTKADQDGESQDAFIYTLLEHQSYPDYWMPLRMWKYSLLLLERHAKKKNKLPIILPLVLYNGQRKYTAPKNLWELFTLPTLAQNAMAGDYNLIDLNAMSDDDIDYEKHLSFVLYTMKHIHDRDTLKMLEQAMQKCTKALIIDKGKDYVHTKLILWYTDSKVPAENKQLLEQLIVDNLPKQDMENIMRTVADTYIEQGVEKGILQGIEKGIEKGANQRNVEIVSRMLKENTDIKFISSVTGLDNDEILKIQNKS